MNELIQEKLTELKELIINKPVFEQMDKIDKKELYDSIN